MTSAGSARSHPPVLLPAALGLLGVALLIAYHGDEAIARALFYDGARGGWIGQGSGRWWAFDLLHTGGGTFVRAVAATALGASLIGGRVAALRAWRAELAYVGIGMIVAALAIGALKQLTNVDCPWDLAGFGGVRPHLAPWLPRPETLPHAACFPGSHSASGYALLSFHFMLRSRSLVAGRTALLAGLLAGSAFSIGQQARGAHFLSHDLASAVLVWVILAALHRAWPALVRVRLRWSGQLRDVDSPGTGVGVSSASRT